MGGGERRQNYEIGRKVKRKKEKKMTRIELEIEFKNMERETQQWWNGKR